MAINIKVFLKDSVRYDRIGKKGPHEKFGTKRSWNNTHNVSVILLFSEQHDCVKVISPVTSKCYA